MIKTMKLTTLIFALLSVNLFAQDFGDFKSSTLTTKAWDALGQGDSDLAIKYVDKCVELYMKEAVKMQKAMKDFAPRSEAAKKWALNDVGTCLYIKAQALIKKGKKEDGVKILKELTEKLKYAQCWDPNGWFWKPAEAAKEKIVEMSLDD